MRGGLGQGDVDCALRRIGMRGRAFRLWCGVVYCGVGVVVMWCEV